MDSLKKASRTLKEISKQLTSHETFDAEQQELIRRVFKSILPQIKSIKDRSLAKEILRRTEWIDG